MQLTTHVRHALLAAQWTGVLAPAMAAQVVPFVAVSTTDAETHVHLRATDLLSTVDWSRFQFTLDGVNVGAAVLQLAGQPGIDFCLGPNSLTIQIGFDLSSFTTGARASFVAPLGGGSSSAMRSTYGCTWQADGLANLEVGSQLGRVISYRFRAARSGQINAAQVFFVYGPGYSHGDGGQVLVALQTDNGMPSHLPSGTALASGLVSDPMTQNFRRVPFTGGPTLVAGRIYHLVFTNPHPDPVHNWTSIDDLHTPQSCTIGSALGSTLPVQALTELAVIWKYDAASPWVRNPRHTPVFMLDYVSEPDQGQAYIGALSASCVQVIGGGVRARERFTVSGPTRSPTRCYVRTRAVAGTVGPLFLTLSDAVGNPIASGSIPAPIVASSMEWVGLRFASPPTLQNGHSYSLVLSAATGSYEVYPVQEGSSYGFASPEQFTDGWFEIDRGDGAGWVVPCGNGARVYDLQLFFDDGPP